MYQYQASIQKSASPWMSLGNYKLEQQRDTTTRLLERPKSETLTIPNAGGNGWQQELPGIAGGDEKWGSHFGSQF